MLLSRRAHRAICSATAIASMLTAVASPTPAFAVLNRWTGITGNNGNFVAWSSTPATNWTTGAVPAPTDDLFIQRDANEGFPQVDGASDWTVNSLEITSGNILRHRASGGSNDLYVTGDVIIQNGGEFEFNGSNASSDLIVGGEFLNNGVLDQQNSGGYVRLTGSGEFRAGATGQDWRKIDISGNYTLTTNWTLTSGTQTDFVLSGSLDLGANSVTLTTNWTGGGTLDADQATVTWSSTDPIPAGVVFNNLIVTQATSILGDLTVLGDLTFSGQGQITTGNNNIDVDGTLTTSRNPSITGNWSTINVGGSLLLANVDSNNPRITGTNGARQIILDTPSNDVINGGLANVYDVASITNGAGNTLTRQNGFSIDCDFINEGTLSATGVGLADWNFDGNFTNNATGNFNCSSVAVRIAGVMTIADGSTTTCSTIIYLDGNPSTLAIPTGATYNVSDTRLEAGNRTVALTGDVIIDSGAITISGSGSEFDLGPYTITATTCATTGSAQRSYIFSHPDSTMNCTNLSMTASTSLDFNDAGGEVNVTGGTVTMGGTLAETQGTINFTNVTITTDNDTGLPNVNIFGTVTLSSGPMNVDGDLTVAPGATFAIGSRNLNLSGDVSQLGTLTSTGGSVVTLDGLGTQTIEGTFRDLTVNKTNDSDVFTTGNVNVRNLYIQNGDLTVSSGDTMTMSGTTTIRTVDESITLDGATLVSNGQLDANGPFTMSNGSTLELGTGITHQFDSTFIATGSGATRNDITRVGGDSGSGSISLSIQGAHNINFTDFYYVGGNPGVDLSGSSLLAAPSGGFNNVTFFDGVGDVTYLRIDGGNYNNRTFTGLAFEDTGGNITTVTRPNATGVTLSEYTSTNGYISGAGSSSGSITWGTVTAAELVFIAARGMHATGTVRVQWLTASEHENLGFRVQRAPSPVGPWTTLDNLIPGLGTSTVGSAYEFIDRIGAGELATTGSVYYRLEDVDFAGFATSHVPTRLVWVDAIRHDAGPDRDVERAHASRRAPSAKAQNSLAHGNGEAANGKGGNLSAGKPGLRRPALAPVSPTGTARRLFDLVANANADADVVGSREQTISFEFDGSFEFDRAARANGLATLVLTIDTGATEFDAHEAVIEVNATRVNAASITTRDDGKLSVVVDATSLNVGTNSVTFAPAPEDDAEMTDVKLTYPAR